MDSDRIPITRELAEKVMGVLDAAQHGTLDGEDRVDAAEAYEWLHNVIAEHTTYEEDDA